jgi:hypothetical protein
MLKDETRKIMGLKKEKKSNKPSESPKSWLISQTRNPKFLDNSSFKKIEY